jgi:hypothetical protein
MVLLLIDFGAHVGPNAREMIVEGVLSLKYRASSEDIGTLRA